MFRTCRHLLPELVGGLLFLTLPTGGEAGGLTKEDEIFLKKAPATMTAAGAGTYKIRLEAVGIFRGELLLGFFNTGAEGRSLDADDLGNGFIGQTLQAESSDFPRFRHQLVQTG